MTIGERIEARAKELNLGATKLGDRIGTTKQNVYSIYKRSSVDTELLKKISKVLDFNFFMWLASGDDDSDLGTFTPQAEYGNLQKELVAVKEENEWLRDSAKEAKEKYELLKSVFKHETGKNPPGSEESSAS